MDWKYSLCFVPQKDLNYHFLLRNFRLKFMSVTLMFGRLDNRFEDFGTEFRLGRA